MPQPEGIARRLYLVDVLDTEVIFRSQDDAVTIGLTTGGWHQMFQAMQMNVWINGRDIYMEPVL